MTTEVSYNPSTEAEPWDTAGEDVFIFPASFSQQRLWFLDQFEPGSPFYNIPSAVRMEGQLDVDALERTLQEIVRRHETLRTTFATEDGQPVQVIWPDRSIALEREDLSHMTVERREAEALRLAEEEARRPFDLKDGPLLRARMLTLSDTEHMILLTMHHIVSDGWSMGVLVGEIAAIYEAFAAGRPSPLPELSIQYADYAQWQREWLQGDVLQAQVDYWKEKLRGPLPVLELPSDRPRPAVQTSRGASLSRVMPRALVDRLRALCYAENATLFMVLTAALEVLLYRYSGQEDLCIGTPIANRNQAEAEQLIGLFINTLVLRDDLSGDPTFRELLARVRETALEAYAHQDLPFEMLVEELKPERDMSHSPLFQVMLILQNAPASAQELPDLKLSTLEVHSGTSTFDLTLSISETLDGLDVSAEYSTDLFDAATVTRMLGHLQRLLESILADPGEHISALNMLGEAERESLLYAWNDTVLSYPEELCVHELFARQAERAPDAVAVVYGGEQITYGELDRRANQLAHYLQERGIGAETLVGICVERSLEALIGIMGILKAGGAYVPMDPNYPQERLSFMLENAEMPVLITQQQLANMLGKLVSTDDQGRPQAQMVCLDTDWPVISQEPEQAPPCEATPDNLAYVIYTSGSTGQPKGVMICHGSLANAYFAWEAAYELHTRVTAHLQMASIAFDVFTGDMVRALCSGGKLVLCPREILLDGAALYTLIQAEEINCAEFVPVVLRQLMQHLERSSQSLSDMRLVICGSDSWYVAEYIDFLRFCGPETRLINSFGLTEATIDSSYFEAQTLSLSEDQLLPIGRPFGNMQLYILDQRMQPLPIGIPGELYVGGKGLARGYLGQPDLTAERFVTAPFGPRLYKTGDMARFLPDGNIQFLGRMDNQVKIRGFRIELGEIEAVLAQHPAVASAAVIAREDTPGDQRLAAYLIPTAGELPPSGELRRWTQDRLPDYMVPSAFVALEALPLTPNGKIDRRALPMPDWGQRGLESSYVAPRTPIETCLAEMFAGVLGTEQVGIHDNFFELGGHSLLATQLVSRIREGLNVDLPLRRVFESPTVATMAEHVEIAQRTGQRAEAPRIQPVPRDGDIPLSFAQQRLWFLDQLEPNSPFYNMPDSVRITGPLNVDILKRVINEIVQRHEVLRTTFATLDGRPVQRIAPSLEIDVPVVDLRALPRDQREAEAERLAQLEAQRPFDLARGPLLRLRLARLADDEHLVLMTAHHIVSDEWSSQVLTREIAVLYEAFSQGRPSPLPELAIQYADFAHWQRQWLQGEVLQEQLDYWRGQLAGCPPMLELPTDRPRPSVQTFNGSFQSFMLPADLALRLHQFCQSEGVTPFMALMAAFQSLLARYSGQDDIVVGTPIANRTRAEIEPLIGFFVNTLVMRADLSDDPSFRALLQRVREAALGAYAHQDLPFEMLVDEVQPQRDLSHSPLFQVMLVLQSAATSQPQQLPDLVLAPAESHSGTAKFDLTLFLTEGGPDQLGAALEYNTDLFDAETIARLCERFQRLLQAMLDEPEARISTLPILSDAERQQVVIAWNDTTVKLDMDRYAHRLFEEQVERTPQAIAATFAGDGPAAGQEHLTYRELNGRANQLAHYLRSLGVGPESLVAISLERSLLLPIGLLGILKAGAAYLPVDPTYPEGRIAFMLQDAGASILLTQESLLGALPTDGLQAICLDAQWEAIASHSRENPQVTVLPENLAYVIYTSGSTGRPKGAMITHGGLANYLAWCQRAYPLPQGQGSPVHSSISFDLTVTSIFTPLISGGRVYLLPEELGIETLTAALAQEDNFSLIKITPAHLELLSQQLSPQQAAGKTHAFIIGGENLLAESVSFWRDHAPQTALVNEYGPTETVVGCCVHTVIPDDPRSGSVHIGRPIANTQLYILDRHLQPLPPGVPGELYIGGLGVARGYLERPDLTAERFVPDPYNATPGARLYRTGDLARFRRDGNIEFLGRIDNQVKIRGFRIELGEIEAVLNEAPGVREAVVMVREDIPGHKRLVAYAVPEHDVSLDSAALNQYMGARLPEYMLPGAIQSLEALPLTPNGKIDRAALPAPELERSEARAYVAPSTPHEETLARVWAQVLGLNEVGVHDNFFELGGDSILAIQVIARANQAGLRITPKQVFQYPTLAALAAVADSAQPIQAEQGLVAGSAPLTPIQRWFFGQDLPEPHYWNQAILLAVHQPLDRGKLEQALSHLLRHHDALRMRFSRAEQPFSGPYTWEQFHADPDDDQAPLTFVDLSKLTHEEQTVQIEMLTRIFQSSLHLEEGPLLRVVVFDLGAQRGQRLFIAAHHLIIDGVSWRILLEDLQTAYLQLLEGQPVRLPPKTTSFKYWAERLAEYARDPSDGSDAQNEIQAQLDYWLDEMGDSSAPWWKAMPLDHPLGDNREGSAQNISVSLTEDETRVLLQEVPPVYHTEINDILLAALALGFKRWSGASEMMISLEGHGREPLFDEVDLSRTVGWFTTLFPVRLSVLDGGDDLGQLIQGVKEHLRGIPQHGIGYGLLRYLSEDAVELMSSLPQPQISFNYLGQMDTAALASGEDQSSVFAAAGEARAPDRSPLGERTHWVEIDGAVADGRLELTWTYSRNVHRPQTIEAFATSFIEALRAIIAHCQSPDAGGYTASDVQEFGWDEGDLGDILAEIERRT